MSSPSEAFCLSISKLLLESYNIPFEIHGDHIAQYLNQSIFGTKCARCDDYIFPSENMKVAKTHSYHVKCFVCSVCNRELKMGGMYGIRDNLLFCPADYETEVTLSRQGIPKADSSVSDENAPPRDGRRGIKRPRSVLPSPQRRRERE